MTNRKWVAAAAAVLVASVAVVLVTRTPVRTIATWGTVCQDATHFGKVDPIVNPGGVSAHDHEFFGAVSVNKNSLPSDLFNHATRCKTTKDGHDFPSCQVTFTYCADFSAYWAPTLKLSGVLVPSVNTVAYYSLGRALNSTPATETTRLAEVAYPSDLEMIAGNGAATTWSQDTQVTKWGCGDVFPTSQQNHPPACPDPDARLHLEIYFPQCWTGVAPIDPTNWAVGIDPVTGQGGTYLAYLGPDGNCAADHPIAWPQLDLNIDYGIYGYDQTLLQLASDVDGDPLTWCVTGQNACSAHADFMQAWDPTTLNELVVNCISGPLTGPTPPYGSPVPPPPPTGPHDCGQILGQPYGH